MPVNTGPVLLGGEASRGGRRQGPLAMGVRWEGDWGTKGGIPRREVDDPVLLFCCFFEGGGKVMGTNLDFAQKEAQFSLFGLGKI